MRTLWQDLRYGARVLRASPGFSAVAVLTLALGVAVSTAVFSWIDTMLLRPVPGISQGQELVRLEAVSRNAGAPISYRDFRDYRDNLKLVAGVAVSMETALSIGEGERAERVWGELVSGNYFAVLGVKPVLGRVFSRAEQDDAPGAHPVAVLGTRLWRNRFHGDPGVVGKTIRVNQSELTIIGVVPPEFGGIEREVAYELWAPLTMCTQLNVGDARMLESRRRRSLMGFARLRSDVPIEQARAELASLAQRLAEAEPDSNTGMSATLLEEAKAHMGNYAQSSLHAPLKLLMAMCFVVLLIVCANVANLLMARSMARQKEFSIRLALGAGRGRLARQLLTEALLLAGLGAVVGIPLAMWLCQSLSYLVPPIGKIVRVGDFQLNGDVLIFTILITVAAALASGVAPALDAMRANVNDSLKETGRSGMASARSHRVRGLLVVSEVALALVALVGAGLFVRSLDRARSINPGFDARNVLIAQFHLSATGYREDQRKQFCQRLRQRLEAAPGVTAVSYADMIPLGFNDRGPGAALEIEGYVPARGEVLNIDRTLAAPGFFDLMGIRLIEGRDFTERDNVDTAPVMIVNQTFARRFFGEKSPIGSKVRAWGGWSTVVGMVKDSKYYSLTEAPLPYFYAPFRQRYRQGVRASSDDAVFYVRTAGKPSDAVAMLRRTAVAIDQNGAVFDAMPLAEYNGAAVFLQRFAASLLSALGVLALLLAAVGLYSVMAYVVSQRTHDIGIRMALGAQPRDVLGMVVRKGLILTGVGVMTGLFAAIGATRLVAGMLVNVSASDPLIFAGAALFLALVALAASYLPARRAAKVDPMVALREQ